MKPLISVSNLQIDAVSAEAGQVPIVSNVSFQVARGKVLALIGESGSGKTTIALSLMGYARRGCKIVGGAIDVAGERIDLADRKRLCQIRGSKVAYVAQSASSAFNPARTIASQIMEAAGKRMSERAALAAKMVTLCRAMSLPNPERIAYRYPHQLSGGQLQRLMIVMALINDPEVVILDEPTTALDVNTQVDVLRCIKGAISNLGISAVYVSHDLAVVAQVADQVVVLRHGKVQENSDIESILFTPSNDYTKSLLQAAAPLNSDDCTTTTSTKHCVTSDIVLSIRDVSATYARGRNAKDSPTSLNNVSFSLRRGESIGVIGESGSGKTTLANCIAGLLRPVSGEIVLNKEILKGLSTERSTEHLRRIQMVFQSAESVLNPKQRVGEILERPLAVFFKMRKAQRKARVRELLDQVQLAPSMAERFPAELSGGQRQRVNLARALAAEPDVMLCDEVTSALDTVVAQAILELLADLRRQLGLSCVFISHDIATVRSMCEQVIVMNRGKPVDQCLSRELGGAGRDAYTKRLLKAVPQLRTGWLDEFDAVEPRVLRSDAA